MKFMAPSFSVPATGKAPENCAHGFLDNRSRCVFCGEKVASKYAGSFADVMGLAMYGADGSHPDSEKLIHGLPCE